MKKKKRILSTLLALCMVISLMPAVSLTVSATGTTFTMTNAYNSGNYGSGIASGDKVTITNRDELVCFRLM